MAKIDEATYRKIVREYYRRKRIRRGCEIISKITMGLAFPGLVGMYMFMFSKIFLVYTPEEESMACIIGIIASILGVVSIIIDPNRIDDEH